MSVQIVDRAADGTEIRKVSFDPKWGDKWHFPTSYLIFKDGNRVPSSERHSALGLARVAIGKGEVRQPKKAKRARKAA